MTLQKITGPTRTNIMKTDKLNTDVEEGATFSEAAAKKKAARKWKQAIQILRRKRKDVLKSVKRKT